MIGGFNKTKVTKKVLSGSTGMGMLRGDNSNKQGIGLSSTSKHTKNPTEGVSSLMGASGHPSLSGAHGNKASRMIAKC